MGNDQTTTNTPTRATQRPRRTHESHGHALSTTPPTTRTRRSVRASAVLVAATAALTLTACGSDSGSANVEANVTQLGTTVVDDAAAPTSSASPTTDDANTPSAPPASTMAPTTVPTTTEPPTTEPTTTFPPIEIDGVDVCELLEDDQVKALTGDDRDFFLVTSFDEPPGPSCRWQGNSVGEGSNQYFSQLAVGLYPGGIQDFGSCDAIDVTFGVGIEGAVQRCDDGGFSPFDVFQGTARGGGIGVAVTVQPIVDLAGQEVVVLIDEVFAALAG